MATEDGAAATRKLHLLDQEAHALLAPVPGEIGRVVARLERYIDKLTMPERDVATLRSAHAVLQEAHVEIERLWRERGGIHR